MLYHEEGKNIDNFVKRYKDEVNRVLAEIKPKAPFLASTLSMTIWRQLELMAHAHGLAPYQQIVSDLPTFEQEMDKLATLWEAFKEAVR